ncbi:MAG: hypothetical protein KA153_01005 [Hyphomonadaceae bacterium]|nr:hypothetical protein [Caulobacteraceae bacterium]MBP6688541.1 hypothetical protein [Hyphomonadaceae bacterium]
MAFFSNETDIEAPWPSLTEPVLVLGEKWSSAHFDALCVEDRSAVADGFWEIADLVASEWLADKTRRPYSRIAAAKSLPLLFLYRHALEATMKAMLADYSEEGEVQIAAYGHNLPRLWARCRALLWPHDDAPGDDLVAAERAIWAFHDVDPHNDAFRYSHDRKGRLIERRRESIDVSALRQAMQGVANFFDCADSELHLQRHGY